MSSLAERLAALKAAQGIKPTVPSTPTEVTTPSTIEAQKDSLKSLIGKVEAKVEAAPETEVAVSAQEVALIVENISALEATPEMKSLEGFNWSEFETSLNRINIKQAESFPEIQTAFTKINKDLRKFPELAHLLTSEQVSAIVQRILIEKNLWIAPVKAAKAPKKTAAAKKAELAAAITEIALDDL